MKSYLVAGYLLAALSSFTCAQSIRRKLPIFVPPGSPHGDQSFKCDYSAMGPDWQSCSTARDRTCWLKNAKTGEKFDIHTDYEFNAPKGVTRHYQMNITDRPFNADGLIYKDGKVINDQYPGPWVQACWGDTIVVKVINNLMHNGTSIHWHGIRQNQTNHMDGVNALTQCAIAPKDHFVYEWKAVQYGTSWYHSHYSVQYSDGVRGPLTLHGPSTDNYDEALKPTLMSDWEHSTMAYAFSVGQLNQQSLTLNGRGNITRFNNSVVAHNIPEPYTIQFEHVATTGLGRAKRYLMRLINTSLDSAFVFTIDHHKMTMVGADFVPIHPYTNSTVLVGIGQRYHVIVEADPVANDEGKAPPKDGNFWIRTWVAHHCGRVGKNKFGIGDKGYERMGILRYNPKSTSEPKSAPWKKRPIFCADETYTSLKPVLKWQVGPPVNKIDGTYGQMFNLTTAGKNLEAFAPLSLFAIGDVPIKVDLGDPTITHLHGNTTWKKEWVVIPEDYKSTDWVWLIMDTAQSSFEFGSHPMHLHGHDFAILAQVENETFTGDISKFNLDNPPRRDVVLVPNTGKGGYVAIAFKADNPGAWLLHCHILPHSAVGLAMQIVERQKDADRMFGAKTEAGKEIQRVCRNWKAWQSDCKNWSNGCDDVFQEDSGL